MARFAKPLKAAKWMPCAPARPHVAARLGVALRGSLYLIQSAHLSRYDICWNVASPLQDVHYSAENRAATALGQVNALDDDEKGQTSFLGLHFKIFSQLATGLASNYVFFLRFHLSCLVTASHFFSYVLHLASW